MRGETGKKEKVPITVHLPQEIVFFLKLQAVTEEKGIGELIAEAVRVYIMQNRDRLLKRMENGSKLILGLLNEGEEKGTRGPGEV